MHSEAADNRRARIIADAAHWTRDTHCYLCGDALGDDSNRDHVPPRRIFPSAIRRRLTVDLLTLRTHPRCHEVYQQDEEYFFNDQGQMMNPTFLDYRMPTSLDLPMIDTVIVEVANPGHPYGVKGVGEVPIVPPMAAISNAIHQAIGLRMDSLPMSPGKILEALWENGKS